MESFFRRFVKLKLDHGVITKDEIDEKGLSKVANLHRLFRHLSIEDHKHYMSEHAFESSYKFAVVRNPYSRLYSFYKFALRIKGPEADKPQVGIAQKSTSFEHFFYSILENQDYDPLLNQITYIGSDNGELQIDEYFKLEEIDDWFSSMLDKTGIGSMIQFKLVKYFWSEKSSLNFINTSTDGVHEYKKSYSNGMIEAMEKVSRDLKVLNYGFD